MSYKSKVHELWHKSPWVTNQKSMSYESKVHELRVKSLWVMNQKSMSYDFYWFQSNFNKKTLPQCLFCLSLYMFLYKRWTESPVYITPNISWTIFSQFPHAFPQINNRLQTNQWQISDRYCKYKQICHSIIFLHINHLRKIMTEWQIISQKKIFHETKSHALSISIHLNP